MLLFTFQSKFSVNLNCCLSSGYTDLFCARASVFLSTLNINSGSLVFLPWFIFSSTLDTLWFFQDRAPCLCDLAGRLFGLSQCLPLRVKSATWKDKRKQIGFPVYFPKQDILRRSLPICCCELVAWLHWQSRWNLLHTFLEWSCCSFTTYLALRLADIPILIDRQTPWVLSFGFCFQSELPGTERVSPFYQSRPLITHGLQGLLLLFVCSCATSRCLGCLSILHHPVQSSCRSVSNSS